MSFMSTTSGSCRGTRSLPPSVHVGGVIAGKYRLDRICGAGGMGIVVEARHLHLHRRVAIKFMSPLLRDNARGVQRFMLEARAAARIECEHVVRVLDVALLEDGTPYIVMEYLEGEDLRELLRTRGRLPVPEAVDYVLQACEAVAEAHRAGIIHRDLKPANLFCCRRADGSPLVKVLDFGVSKLLPTADLNVDELPVTSSHVIIGSPPYSSPEQLRGPHDVDGRTDIWALGAILYELVSGRTPFAADGFLEVCSKVMHAPVEPLGVLRPGIERLDAVIAHTLAKERERRFETVADLAVALAPFAPRRSLLSVERIATNLHDEEGRLAPQREARRLPLTGRPRAVRRASAVLCLVAGVGAAASIVAWVSITAMADAAPTVRAVVPDGETAPGRADASTPATPSTASSGRFQASAPGR